MSDDVTEKVMTSAQKLLLQNIYFMIDNICEKFHDVTYSSSKVIHSVFYLQKSPVLF